MNDGASDNYTGSFDKPEAPTPLELMDKMRVQFEQFVKSQTENEARTAQGPFLKDVRHCMPPTISPPLPTEVKMADPIDFFKAMRERYGRELEADAEVKAQVRDQMLAKMIGKEVAENLRSLVPVADTDDPIPALLTALNDVVEEANEALREITRMDGDCALHEDYGPEINKIMKQLRRVILTAKSALDDFNNGVVVV